MTADAARSEGALGPYLRALRAHRLLVLAIVALTVVGGALLAKSRTREYKATAHMLITPLPQDDAAFLGLPLIRDSGDPTRTVQTAATIIDSTEAATQAATRLGPSWSARRVQSQVSVEPEGESNVVGVTATADSAALAARLANEYTGGVVRVRREQIRTQVADALQRARAQLAALPANAGDVTQELTDRVSRLQGAADGSDPTLRVSEPAVRPAAASGVSTSLLIILALIVGAVLGTGVALLVELVRADRISDEDELLAGYGLPVLARVPEVARRRRENPLELPPFIREAFRTLQVQLELAPGRHRIVALTSASGGDGKTTSALNFALELAGAGQDVILMDLDLRKPDLSRRLGLAGHRGIASLLAGETTLSEALRTVPDVPGIRVVAAAGLADIADLELLSDQLPQIVSEALELADYVVIDTPPVGEVSDALKLTGPVDDLLLVARLGHTNNGAFEVTRDLLERVGRRPTGFVLIGSSARLPSSQYYSYGDPPATGRGPAAKAPAAKAGIPSA